MNENFNILPIVFLGGGIGASLRWAISFFSLQLGALPWTSTLIANTFGTLIYFLSFKFSIENSSHYFLRVGLLGSLTTFSTFSFEVFSAVKNGQNTQAAVIFGLNILAGVVIAIGVLR